LNDVEARLALAAEQSVVADLGGGCQLPLGVHAEIRGAAMRLRALAASMTGDDVVSAEVSGEALAAHELGRQLAAQLAARGAGALMRS
jgi:hydroxymethylbilane synthase